VISRRFSKATCELIGGSDMTMRLTSTVTSILIALLFLRQAHAVEWTRVVGLDSPGVDNSIGLAKRVVVVGRAAVPAKQERGETSENQKTTRKWQSHLLCRSFPKEFGNPHSWAKNRGETANKICICHNCIESLVLGGYTSCCVARESPPGSKQSDK